MAPKHETQPQPRRWPVYLGLFTVALAGTIVIAADIGKKIVSSSGPETPFSPRPSSANTLPNSPDHIQGCQRERALVVKGKLLGVIQDCATDSNDSLYLDENRKPYEPRRYAVKYTSKVNGVCVQPQYLPNPDIYGAYKPLVGSVDYEAAKEQDYTIIKDAEPDCDADSTPESLLYYRVFRGQAGLDKGNVILRVSGGRKAGSAVGAFVTDCLSNPPRPDIAKGEAIQPPFCYFEHIPAPSIPAPTTIGH